MSSPKCRKGHLSFNAGYSHAGLRLLITTAIVGLSSLAFMPLSVASAQETTSRVSTARTFNIPSQPLASALNAFGRQSGLQVTLAAATSKGIRSTAVSGTLEPQQALEQLLSGTGISYSVSGRTELIGSATATGSVP